MKWINVLHLYQPPTQEIKILNKVVNESYEEIIKILNRYPALKFTINIAGCLTEQLANNGYQNIINSFKKLSEQGQIELIGSVAFHPILPLIPDFEIIKQIKINQDINKKYFGETYKPTGFYLPEMAYSKKVAKIIKESGFQWIILDELSLSGKFGIVENDIKYIIKDIGLPVIFRNREISKTFVPAWLLENIDLNINKTIITATDGELYGHHHKDWEHKIDRLLANKNLNTFTVSQYLKQLEKEKKVSPIKSTWESTEEELKNKNYYPLWDDPNNKLHHKLWNLAKLAIKLNNQHQDDINQYASRLHLEKGIASCTFWWCSNKTPSAFCPPTWNPDEIEKGVENLIRSIRSLKNLDKQEKQKAEKIYIIIKKLIWQQHWQ